MIDYLLTNLLGGTWGRNGEVALPLLIFKFKFLKEQFIRNLLGGTWGRKGEVYPPPLFLNFSFSLMVVVPSSKIEATL